VDIIVKKVVSHLNLLLFVMLDITVEPALLSCKNVQQGHILKPLKSTHAKLVLQAIIAQLAQTIISLTYAQQDFIVLPKQHIALNTHVLLVLLTHMKVNKHHQLVKAVQQVHIVIQKGFQPLEASVLKVFTVIQGQLLLDHEM
jgi:hypothetical protein